MECVLCLQKKTPSKLRTYFTWLNPNFLEVFYTFEDQLWMSSVPSHPLCLAQPKAAIDSIKLMCSFFISRK